MRELYCTRHAINSHGEVRGHNHGALWDENQERELYQGYHDGLPPLALANKMGRTLNSILPRLCRMGLIEADGHYNYYRRVQPKCVAQTEAQPEIKEIDMTQAIIETNTTIMIQGRDAATVSDDEIFKLIAKLELEADNLSKIMNKPKKLGKKIENIHADIKKLVEYVDGR